MEQTKGMLLKVIVWFMTAMLIVFILIPFIVGTPWIIRIVWSSFCILFLFLLHGVIYKKIKANLKIIEEGFKGTATILSITEHPEFQSQYSTLDIFTTILFSVEIQSKPPYTLEKKERISPILYKKFKIGSVVPIRISKTDANEVIFLLDEIKMNPQ